MKRVSLAVLSLGLAGLAAACTPSGPGLFAGTMAPGGGAIAASNGYNGSGQYSCAGVAAYTVTGSGSSIDIQLPSETVTLVGGPLVYAGPSNSVTFQSGYGSFVWSAGGSTLTCTRV